MPNLYFGPGQKDRHVLSIINASNKNVQCGCPKNNAKKVLLTSNNNNIGETATQRAVNSIKYSLGGKIQFGNNLNQSNINSITPIKNKF